MIFCPSNNLQVDCEFCDDGTEFTSSATGSGTGSGTGFESDSNSGDNAEGSDGDGGGFDYNDALNNLGSLDPNQDLARNTSK